MHLKKSAWKSSRVAKQTLLNIVTILSKRRVWNKSCCRFLFSCLSVLFLILLLYPYFSTRFSTMTMILWCVCVTVWAKEQISRCCWWFFFHPFLLSAFFPFCTQYVVLIYKIASWNALRAQTHTLRNTYTRRRHTTKSLIYILQILLFIYVFIPFYSSLPCLVNFFCACHPMIFFRLFD